MKNNHVTIIAEAGVNHNGSLEMAMELICMAAEAKADIVKFQTFKAENLVTQSAPKAEYQKAQTDEKESQQAMLKKYELSLDDHKKLLLYCREKNIEFLSSPFDIDSLNLLSHELGLNKIKIPSGEITNAPLLLAAAQLNKDIILSTGMSTLEDIENALSVLAFGYLNRAEKPSLSAFREAYRSLEGKHQLMDHVTLLHCTSAYPAPIQEVNLRAMNLMKKTFNLPVGYSDHTPGINVPIAAVARGASVIEKHFTLDKNLPGPDHKASLDPQQLVAMVSGIREVEQALGKEEKYLTHAESKNIDLVRKSIVAAKPIKKGEIFNVDNIAVKRPGCGFSPMLYWELLGKESQTYYDVGMGIEE